MAYQAQMVHLVKTFLKILRRGLPESWNCAPNVLDVLTENASIPMRLLHYGPQPTRNEKQFGGKSMIHLDPPHSPPLPSKERPEGTTVVLG